MLAPWAPHSPVQRKAKQRAAAESEVYARLLLKDCHADRLLQLLLGDTSSAATHQASEIGPPSNLFVAAIERFLTRLA